LIERVFTDNLSHPPNPCLANPDLVERLRADAPLNAPGDKGYTDFPVLAEAVGV
jgi:hypothetical protein